MLEKIIYWIFYWRKVPVRYVKWNRYTANAIETSPQIFIKNRFTNKVNKANDSVGKYSVLHISYKWVYWGKPRFSLMSLISDRATVVKPLYRTSLDALNTYFPRYRRVDGRYLRHKIRKIIFDHHGEYIRVSIDEINATISPSSIDIVVQQDIDNSYISQYNIVLDKNTLEIISFDHKNI